MESPLPALLAAVEYGQYVSAFKAIPLVIILLIWARLLTWADKDAQDAHMPRALLNSAFMSGFVLAFALFLFLPNYWAALGAMLAIFAAEVATYLILRQQKVGLGDLSKQFNAWLRSFGGGKKAKAAKAGEVQFFGAKGDVIDVPENDAPERAGYDAIQEVFAQPLRLGAERVEMQPTEGASKVRYWVDGVSYEAAQGVNRNDASSAVLLLKSAMRLDISDRRKPQLGNMKASLDGKKFEMQVLTAGSTAGESFVAEVNPKSRHEHRLHEMGFTNDQYQVLEDAIGEGTGVVLLATPKGQGLTSLLYAVLRRHDAFLSHIQTIERDPPTDMEGITQNELPLGAAAGEETKLVAWVTSQEPDILMIDRIDEPKSTSDLIRFASTGKRVYVGMRAANTFEALQQWIKLVGDPKKAMGQLKLIVAGRVMRKLCMACKQEYAPDPETLRKMNMPADRVSKLFQARTPTNPMRDQKGNVIICNFCGGLGFQGRTGVYEIFSIDDEVRQTVIAGGSVNQLKMLFKKQRRRYIQEIAVLQAVQGETSLQEVARVLRVSDAPTSSGSSGGGGGGAPASGGQRPPSSSSPRRPAPRT